MKINTDNKPKIDAFITDAKTDTAWQTPERKKILLDLEVSFKQGEKVASAKYDKKVAEVTE